MGVTKEVQEKKEKIRYKSGRKKEEWEMGGNLEEKEKGRVKIEEMERETEPRKGRVQWEERQWGKKGKTNKNTF